MSDISLPRQKLGKSFSPELVEESDTDVVNLEDYDRDDAIYIGRSSKFGNPYHMREDGGDHSRAESISRYRVWFRAKVQTDPEFREAVEELRGETLGCWCRPSPCHGDIIVEWLEETADEKK